MSPSVFSCLYLTQSIFAHNIVRTFSNTSQQATATVMAAAAATMVAAATSCSLIEMHEKPHEFGSQRQQPLQMAPLPQPHLRLPISSSLCVSPCALLGFIINAHTDTDTHTAYASTRCIGQRCVRHAPCPCASSHLPPPRHLS